jgi:hypothetical protein
MAVTLTIGFFVYFFVLFTILLSPNRIADWTHTQFSTIQVTAKVSLLLACFVSVFASISGLSDDKIRAIITGWLTKKSTSWLATSALYTCGVSPNYYVWEYIARNKPGGIANVLIVVRRGLSPKQIEQACEHMESRLASYENFVRVTAFEQNDKSTYRLDLPDNRWQLSHNKTKNMRSFEAITIEDDELRYQHLLGRDALRDQTPIPDEWFGNTPDTVGFSKGLWDADVDHEWILHPYISKHGEPLSIEIHLAKRKTKSQQYHEYVREIFRLTRQSFPDVELVMMDLYYRDTTDNLVRVLWNSQLSFVDYKDETMKETRYERQKDWN